MIVTLDVSNLEIGKIDENGNDVYSSEHMRCFGYIPVYNDNYEDFKFVFNMTKIENDSIDAEKAIEGTVIFYDEALRILGIKTFTPERMIIDYPRDENDKIYIVKYIRFYVNWINHYKFDFFVNKITGTLGLELWVNVNADKIITVSGQNRDEYEKYIDVSYPSISSIPPGSSYDLENNPDRGIVLYESGRFMIYDRIGETENTSCRLMIKTFPDGIKGLTTPTVDNIDTELDENGVEFENVLMEDGNYLHGRIIIYLEVPANYVCPNFRFSPIIYSGFSLNELVIESVPEWEFIYDMPENVLHMFTSDFSVNTIIPSSIWNQNDNYNDGIPFLDLLPTIEYTDKHKEEEHLELLDEVRIISYPHGLDTYLPITRMEITPDKPLNSTYTIGETKKQTISSRVNKIKK